MYHQRPEDAVSLKTQQAAIIADFKAPLTLGLAPSFPDFFQSVRNLVGDLSFTDFSITYLAEESESCAPFTTMPESLIENYTKSSLQKYDCSLRYAQGNGDKPVFKNEIDAWLDEVTNPSEYLVSNKELKKLSRHYGYHDHFLIPIKSCFKQTKGLFTVSCKSIDKIRFKQLVKKHEKELMAIAVATDYIGAHKFSKNLFGHKQESTIQIPYRCFKVLDVLANNDVNLKQAAQILCISEASIKKYTADLRDILNCKTTTGAITKALREGLIKLRDPDKGS